MSHETAFFIFGIALAVSAVLVAFAGLRYRDFPGKAMPFVVLWFAFLVGGATTFAVLHSKDEGEKRAAEYEQAGKEIEKASSSGPFEKAETEAAAKGGAEEAAGGEEGAQVFASAGCGSCHGFEAAGSGEGIGPNLNEFLAPDDNKKAIEEMIVDPNAEIAEGYSANIMPQNFGELLSEEELASLVDYLYVNSPAGEGKKK